MNPDRPDTPVILGGVRRMAAEQAGEDRREGWTLLLLGVPTALVGWFVLSILLWFLPTALWDVHP